MITRRHDQKPMGPTQQLIGLPMLARTVSNPQSTEGKATQPYRGFTPRNDKESGDSLYQMS